MAHCGRFLPAPLSRRQMLARCASGFGAVALTALMADDGRASGALSSSIDPLSPKPAHFDPQATSVIFLYMDGGPSQVDTFDPKPRLQKESGKPFGMEVDTTTLQFNNMGNSLGSHWEFKQYGESGLPVSSLFKHVGEHADDLAVIRSMVSNFPEHTNANYFLHTGHGIQGRPSMGAWIGYGLGSVCRDLPGFIVLNGGLIPPGGLDCFGSGFLSASYQGSIFSAGDTPVANINRTEARIELQKNKLALLRQLDAQVTERLGPDDEVESAIANYELAFRMQAAVPDLMDLRDETAATKKLYGLENPVAETYGRQCLLARRLVERGVRFIELTCGNKPGADRWDQHANLKAGHESNAAAVDQPIAGLLADLKQRGLLDKTLVVWGGEFGRTPFAQGGDGRDHNPFGFSMWMAGGGIKGGSVYGATDEYGYKAIEDKVEIHDLHATMLHLLGVDHTRQTFRFGGRDMRLTDVHGNVLHDILR